MPQKRSVRIDDALYEDITAIADQENKSANLVIDSALKFYRDMYYMENRATFINEEMLKVFKANLDLLLQQINHKSNRLLSELSIQSAIQNLILAHELDVDELRLQQYRQQAVEFLKANNRILRLDELNG